MSKQLDLTTGLDLAGLGLVAAGTGAGLWQFIGPFGLIPSGLVVIVGSLLSTRKA
jgi:hypothetical protein